MIMMKNYVYEYRKKIKMTQGELAEALGVTRQTIISIEQSKYIASLQLALKIAKLFDCKVEDIFVMEEGD